MPPQGPPPHPYYQSLDNWTSSEFVEGKRYYEVEVDTVDGQHDHTDDAVVDRQVDGEKNQQVNQSRVVAIFCLLLVCLGISLYTTFSAAAMRDNSSSELKLSLGPFRACASHSDTTECDWLKEDMLSCSSESAPHCERHLSFLRWARASVSIASTVSLILVVLTALVAFAPHLLKGDARTWMARIRLGNGFLFIWVLCTLISLALVRNTENNDADFKFNFYLSFFFSAGELVVAIILCLIKV